MRSKVSRLKRRTHTRHYRISEEFLLELLQESTLLGIIEDALPTGLEGFYELADDVEIDLTGYEGIE